MGGSKLYNAAAVGTVGSTSTINNPGAVYAGLSWIDNQN